MNPVLLMLLKGMMYSKKSKLNVLGNDTDVVWLIVKAIMKEWDDNIHIVSLEHEINLQKQKIRADVTAHPFSRDFDIEIIDNFFTELKYCIPNGIPYCPTESEYKKNLLYSYSKESFTNYYGYQSSEVTFPEPTNININMMPIIPSW